jgi:hypothetical protein
MAEEDKENKPRAQDTFKEATQGGITDPAHPELGPQQAYVDEHDPTKIHYLGPMPTKAAAGKDEPLGDRVVNLNKALTDRYQVRNPGKPLPPELTLPANATTADYTRADQAMQQIEGATATKAQQAEVSQEHADTAAAKKTEDAGKVYDKYNTQLDKLKTPADATAARANLAIHNLDLKTKQADSLVAPEILTLAAGGQGSGLRMNEAEISRIVGGRSVWDALVAHAHKVMEGSATFDDTQRGQLRQIASYIAERSAATSTVLDQARENMLAGQNDEAAVRRAYTDGNRVASAIQRKGVIPPGGTFSPGDYIMFNGQVMIIDEKGKGHPAL